MMSFNCMQDRELWGERRRMIESMWLYGACMKKGSPLQHHLSYD